MAIGLLPVFSPPPEFTTRSFLVMTAFLVAGGRMALGRLFITYPLIIRYLKEEELL